MKESIKTTTLQDIGEGNMYETDNRLRFQDGRLYITQTPFKDGKQIDFPEIVDVTEDVLNTFIEIIKERDRNRCK